MGSSRAPVAARVAVAAALLAVLAAAAWESGKRFLADASRAEVRYYVDRSNAGTLKLDAARVDELHAQMIRAVALDPGNPRIEFELANLLFIHPDNRNFADPAVIARRTEIRDRNARVVQLRPTYELAWGNLALARLQLSQLDEPFFTALELSLRYGPWNQDVQMNAIRLGLLAWPVLPPRLQAQLRQAIHNQAHWRLSPQAGPLRTAITAVGRKELLCLLEPEPKGCVP